MFNPVFPSEWDGWQTFEFFLVRGGTFLGKVSGDPQQLHWPLQPFFPIASELENCIIFPGGRFASGGVVQNTTQWYPLYYFHRNFLISFSFFLFCPGKRSELKGDPCLNFWNAGFLSNLSCPIFHMVYRVFFNCVGPFLHFFCRKLLIEYLKFQRKFTPLSAFNQWILKLNRSALKIYSKNFQQIY